METRHHHPKEYYYSFGRRTAHGYDIYDVENCTHVTRTRKDIRKYRQNKMERLAMEQINKNLGEIREEYFKNKDFIGPGFKTPPEFILKGYDDEPTPAAIPTAVRAPEESHPRKQELAPDHPTEETATEPDKPQPEAPGVPEQAPQIPTPEQNRAKVPRMVSRLSNELNGPTWNVGPLTRRTRYVTALINCFDAPGDLEATYDNTEPVPDDGLNHGPENPEAPEQEALVNRDI